jgi:hypothetical protein
LSACCYGSTERGLSFVVEVGETMVLSARYQERAVMGGRRMLDEHGDVIRVTRVPTHPIWLGAGEADLSGQASQIPGPLSRSIDVIDAVPYVVAALVIDGWGSSIADVVSWFGGDGILTNDWFPVGASLGVVGVGDLEGFSGPVSRTEEGFTVGGVSGVLEGIDFGDLILSVKKSVDAHSNRVHTAPR